MENDFWQKTLFHLDKGNFTALEEMLGASVTSTVDWWHEQRVCDADTKKRVLDALQRRGAK